MTSHQSPSFRYTSRSLIAAVSQTQPFRWEYEHWAKLICNASPKWREVFFRSVQTQHNRMIATRDSSQPITGRPSGSEKHVLIYYAPCSMKIGEIRSRRYKPLSLLTRTPSHTSTTGNLLTSPLAAAFPNEFRWSIAPARFDTWTRGGINCPRSTSNKLSSPTGST